MSFEDPQQPYPRSPTAQPYRGPRRTHRDTGRVEVWVEGRGYVPQDSLDRLTTQERQAVLDARERARGQREALPLLRRFEQLNGDEATGSVGQIIGQTLNVPTLLGDPEETEMDAIRDRLTPRQRQGMPGAASDRDVSMFRGSLPGLHRTGPSNSNIIRGLEREAAESQAYAEFLDWYWPRHGTTSGIEEEWGRYRREVPDMSRPWRDYFGAGGVPARAAAPSSQQAAPRRTRYDAEGRRIE